MNKANKPGDDIVKNLLLLAKQHQQSGNMSLAANACHKAVEMNPNSAEILFAAGHILNQMGQLDNALAYYTKSLELRPDPLTHANIGIVLQHKGLFQDAIPHYLSALAIYPNNVDLLGNLGSAYRMLGQHDKAYEIYSRAISIAPDNQRPLQNMANLLKDYGMLKEAIAYYKKALVCKPDSTLIYTNLLLSSVYSDDISSAEYFETARAFGKLTDHILPTQRQSIDMNPSKRLRIGYVSADFRAHPVNYFFEYIPRMHNRDHFEVFAYSNVLKEDEVTKRIRGNFDHWRNIRDVNDNAVADMIRSDKIDILVDLSGHTADNRLLVFARKPAPVQATWLGYPATTGMKAMDYRIIDNHTEPTGTTEYLNTETLYRLPHIFCCYQGHESNPVVIDHPPFEDNGYITFGCFNTFSKVSDDALKSWAEIMKRTSGSRLLLEVAGLEWEKFRTDLEKRLAAMDIERDRIILEPRRKSNQFVLYNKIDIALDPFPCVGGTTSMDTLWMGVPLVTLAGDRFVSRMGVTILENLDLTDMVANNREKYIEIASSLANDRPRLKNLRQGLRERVMKSPLMDQTLFVNDLEEAYRNMWHKFCQENGRPT